MDKCWGKILYHLVLWENRVGSLLPAAAKEILKLSFDSTDELNKILEDKNLSGDVLVSDNSLTIFGKHNLLALFEGNGDSEIVVGFHSTAPSGSVSIVVGDGTPIAFCYGGVFPKHLDNLIEFSGFKENTIKNVSEVREYCRTSGPVIAAERAVATYVDPESIERGFSNSDALRVFANTVSCLVDNQFDGNWVVKTRSTYPR